MELNLTKGADASFGFIDKGKILNVQRLYKSISDYQDKIVTMIDLCKTIFRRGMNKLTD